MLNLDSSIAAIMPVGPAPAIKTGFKSSLMFVLQPCELVWSIASCDFFFASRGSEFLLLSENGFVDFVFSSDTSKTPTKHAETEVSEFLGGETRPPKRLT